MQMAELFGKDRTVIGRHIRNAIKEGEIDSKTICAKFTHTTQQGAFAGLKMPLWARGGEVLGMWA